MSNDTERLGERVTVSDLSDAPIQGGLPHPQDPWAASAGIDTPFRGAAPAGTRRLGAETAYDPHGTLPDPLSAAAERRNSPAPSASAQQTAAPSPKVEPKGTRPVPQTAKVTRKETKTLTRFREVFGLQRIKVVPVSLKRCDPNDPTQNVEIIFGLRGINYEDYQWVLDKTQEAMQNPSLAAFAWKIAFVSMGVASIDGEPIWSVLGFEPSSPEHVSDPMYPHMGLRFQAANAFYDELRSSLFDTIEHLYTAYEDKVDSTYLPKKKVVEKKEEDTEGTSGPLTQTGSES